MIRATQTSFPEQPPAVSRVENDVRTGVTGDFYPPTVKIT